MAITGRNKHVPSQYKYVRGWIKNTEGHIHWCVNIRGVAQTAFETERLAAIAADKYLISKGKKPVNILIAK